jgi:hypothetical protein
LGDGVQKDCYLLCDGSYDSNLTASKFVQTDVVDSLAGPQQIFSGENTDQVQSRCATQPHSEHPEKTHNVHAFRQHWRVRLTTILVTANGTNAPLRGNRIRTRRESTYRGIRESEETKQPP